MPRIEKFFTDGKIFFNQDSLLHYLNLSLQSHFKYVQPFTEHNGKWENDCEGYTNKNIENIGLNDEDGYSTDILFSIKHITTKNFDVDVSFGPSYYFQENDRHNIEYVLTIAIFKRDELIYMDNRTYWDNVYSNRGEQLDFAVRKTSIDSLMNLSLKKYHQRTLD